MEQGYSDEEIYDLIDKGESQEAWEIIIEQYKDDVFSLCKYMLGANGDWEDTAQVVFRDVLPAMSRFRRDCSIRTWLLQIAKYKCYREMRRLKYFGWLKDNLIYKLRKEKTGGNNSNDEVLSNFLQKLEAIEKEVVIHYGILGCTHREVSETLGITEEKSQRIWRKALVKLKKLGNEEASDE